MSVSEPFIRRPIATSLLGVALLIGGLLGYLALPVSALPQVDFPTVQVTTQLPGASPDVIAALQAAVQTGDKAAYRRYARLVNERPTTVLRDLLELKPAGDPVPIVEVESAAEIVKRFDTAAMSLGALSPEAHEALAIAMNTYFQKIASPEDIASSAGVSFTINHIAVVVIPAALGLVWIVSNAAVFLIGAGFAVCSLLLSQNIPSRPREGNEVVWGKVSRATSQLGL